MVNIYSLSVAVSSDILITYVALCTLTLLGLKIEEGDTFTDRT
jgi:hypothetical protein